MRRRHRKIGYLDLVIPARVYARIIQANAPMNYAGMTIHANRDYPHILYRYDEEGLLVWTLTFTYHGSFNQGLHQARVADEAITDDRLNLKDFRGDPDRIRKDMITAKLFMP